MSQKKMVWRHTTSSQTPSTFYSLFHPLWPVVNVTREPRNPAVMTHHQFEEFDKENLGENHTFLQDDIIMQEMQNNESTENGTQTYYFCSECFRNLPYFSPLWHVVTVTREPSNPALLTHNQIEQFDYTIGGW